MPSRTGGYRMSKVVVNQYVAHRLHEVRRAGRAHQLPEPGSDGDAMMPAFEDAAGKGTVENALGAIHRYSQPEEQAWPMVCLNSPRFSYVTGEALWVDGGFLGDVVDRDAPGLRDGLSRYFTFTWAANGGDAELGGGTRDHGAAHEHRDEVATVGAQVAVGAGRAEEAVAVRDVVGPDVVRVEVHPVGVDVHLHAAHRAGRDQRVGEVERAEATAGPHEPAVGVDADTTARGRDARDRRAPGARVRRRRAWARRRRRACRGSGAGRRPAWRDRCRGPTRRRCRCRRRTR